MTIVTMLLKKKFDVLTDISMEAGRESRKEKEKTHRGISVRKLYAGF
jgi:hypothetical protein